MGPTPKVSAPVGLGGVREFTFLTSAQVVLLQLIQEPHFALLFVVHFLTQKKGSIFIIASLTLIFNEISIYAHFHLSVRDEFGS